MRVTSQSLKTFRVIIMCFKVCSVSNISRFLQSPTKRGQIILTKHFLKHSSITFPLKSWINLSSVLKIFCWNVQALRWLNASYSPFIHLSFQHVPTLTRRVRWFHTMSGLVVGSFVENWYLVNMSSVNILKLQKKKTKRWIICCTCYNSNFLPKQDRKRNS